MLEDIIVALQKGMLRHPSRRKPNPRKWETYVLKRAPDSRETPKPPPPVPTAWHLYLQSRGNVQ